MSIGRGRIAFEQGANLRLLPTHRQHESRKMNFPKPAVGMLPNDRLDYSAITERKPLELPNRARMVVWTITNVEEWDPTQPMPRTVLTPPAGGSPMPDIPNWCWHEYGNRVGFWRLLQIYDEFKIPGVMNINGIAVDAFPEIVKACVERKWEFLGHGYTQRNLQKVENEREDIRKSALAIAKATGKRPRGWLGPGLTESWETPDILAEEGYDYVADWVLDDQPAWLKTRSKPILNIPYTQECNDVAMMLIQHHKASEFYERAMDQFEQIYKDAKGSARVMAISVHPYLMGAPHRAKYFRKIFERLARNATCCSGPESRSRTGIVRPARGRRRARDRMGKGHRDKVAVITGAANGIGQAFARRLAEEGVHVVDRRRAARRPDGEAGREVRAARHSPVAAM